MFVPEDLNPELVTLSARPSFEISRKREDSQTSQP